MNTNFFPKFQHKAVSKNISEHSNESERYIQETNNFFNEKKFDLITAKKFISAFEEGIKLFEEQLEIADNKTSQKAINSSIDNFIDESIFNNLGRNIYQEYFYNLKPILNFRNLNYNGLTNYLDIIKKYANEKIIQK